MKVCLDLFSGLGGRPDVEGGFSDAFQRADGWRVYTVDLDPDERFDPDLRADILELRPSDLPEWVKEADVLIVLASPPCETFSVAASRYEHFPGGQPPPATDRARDAVGLVYHTLGIIEALGPRFWFLENPVGNLRKVLDSPTGTVTWCQYGTEYMKPTDLWGEHPPMEYRRCLRGDDCHVANTDDDGWSAVGSMPRDRAKRALIPQGFSEAVLEAVERALAGPPEQRDLGSFAAAE